MNRDLNPHKAAVAAMWLYGHEYSQQNLGSMGFWDQLDEHRKELCRRLVQDIENAPKESA
jgi:hypothetical protein